MGFILSLKIKQSCQCAASDSCALGTSLKCSPVPVAKRVADESKQVLFNIPHIHSSTFTLLSSETTWHLSCLWQSSTSPRNYGGVKVCVLCHWWVISVIQVWSGGRLFGATPSKLRLKTTCTSSPSQPEMWDSYFFVCLFINIIYSCCLQPLLKQSILYLK